MGRVTPTTSGLTLTASSWQITREVVVAAIGSAPAQVKGKPVEFRIVELGWGRGSGPTDRWWSEYTEIRRSRGVVDLSGRLRESPSGDEVVLIQAPSLGGVEGKRSWVSASDVRPAPERS
jgi:hypothetical protein